VAAAPGFEDWYRARYDKLVRSVRLMAGDPVTAEDVASEAFSRALARWDRVGAMSSPDGWVYRVAVNVLRRRQRRATLERAVLGRWAPARDAPPPDDHSSDVWRAVRSLPARSREAVVLRYVSDLTESAVAAARGISEGAASSLLSDARRALARQLKGFDG